MRRAKLRTLTLVGVLAATMLIGAVGAHATSTRATKGDAQAGVQRQPDRRLGDSRTQRGRLVGPAANRSADGIRITGFIDGLHYCSLDWHVISVTLSDGNFPGGTRTSREIATDLSALSETIYVDGVRSHSGLTAVKPLVDPAVYGLVNGFWFTTGRVMAPSDLTIGPHSLATELRDAAGTIVLSSNVTFVIDSADVGACVSIVGRCATGGWAGSARPPRALAPRSAGSSQARAPAGLAVTLATNRH